MKLQGLVIAAVAVSVASFSAGLGIGWKFVGYTRGFDAGVKSVETQYAALHEVAVNTMRGKQQCVTQVEKVNNAVAEQREENRKILIEDRVATQEAITKFQLAAQVAADNTKKTQLQIAEARNEMVKIKDACVNAGVPAEFFSVLNRTLETPAAAD